jgi:hypothetical protein
VGGIEAAMAMSWTHKNSIIIISISGV